MSAYYMPSHSDRYVFHADHVADPSTFRPVVVIDPEDREQVERLTKAVVEACHRDGNVIVAGTGIHPNTTARALREFANPTPPRIDEPGVWGVVEASCVHSVERREWMLHRNGNWYAIGIDANNNPDDWDSLIDPVLVREGVTA